MAAANLLDGSNGPVAEHLLSGEYRRSASGSKSREGEWKDSHSAPLTKKGKYEGGEQRCEQNDDRAHRLLFAHPGETRRRSSSSSSSSVP